MASHTTELLYPLYLFSTTMGVDSDSTGTDCASTSTSTPVATSTDGYPGGTIETSNHIGDKGTANCGKANGVDSSGTANGAKANGAKGAGRVAGSAKAKGAKGAGSTGSATTSTSPTVGTAATGMESGPGTYTDSLVCGTARSSGVGTARSMGTVVAGFSLQARHRRDRDGKWDRHR